MGNLMYMSFAAAVQVLVWGVSSTKCIYFVPLTPPPPSGTKCIYFVTLNPPPPICTEKFRNQQRYVKGIRYASPAGFYR
jgi:hypothetical protein